MRCQSSSFPGPASNLYWTQPSSGFSQFCRRTAKVSHSGSGIISKIPSFRTTIPFMTGVIDWIGLHYTKSVTWEQRRSKARLTSHNACRSIVPSVSRLLCLCRWIAGGSPRQWFSPSRPRWPGLHQTSLQQPFCSFGSGRDVPVDDRKTVPSRWPWPRWHRTDSVLPLWLSAYNGFGNLMLVDWGIVRRRELGILKARWSWKSQVASTSSLLLIDNA